jgi:nucleoside-diphosphate-sugar epimerase
MRAFVTGGSGFLGRHLIGYLRRRGDEVNALARSDRAAAAVKEAGAEPVAGDLDDEAALAAGMAGCDVIYHSGAKVEVWGDPAEFHRINVGGTERVIAAAKKTGVPCLVHVGTEAVLVGGPPIVRATEERPLPKKPVGLYPLTKGLAEQRVVAANSPSLRTVVVRPRYVWGKGDTSALPILVDLVKRKKFKWISGGRHLTSTCHVENVCEGMVLAAERGRGGEVYFLTDGEPVVLREFLGAIFDTQGVDPGDGSVPHWIAAAGAWIAELVWRTFRLSGEPPINRTALVLIGEEVTVSDEKARRELGYLGKKSRADGLREMRS